ncbi:hypothetical protein F1643_21665 [Azospirillum sp. INR13]|uniref:hypothetical protein n=1 Tax=Azospirillum sp. INR13 TaxID=2596919 RepID=UPI0018920A67|nr:hypothetical protein [Azospirillum sp. INR13]MBF5096597.1 hypothetical protein [Azospirillum sp. INR13]
MDQALLTHVALFERDERRIATMTPAEAEVPILTVGMAGGTTQVIDGLHRIHRRHRDGKRDIAMVFVPHAVAQPSSTRAPAVAREHPRRSVVVQLKHQETPCARSKTIWPPCWPHCPVTAASCTR